MSVTVNGVEIDEQQIATETQNHPSETLSEAREEATRALVVRELLLQEARRLNFAPDPQLLAEGKRETDEDSQIRQLLDDQLDLPTADEATCRHYYDNNRQRFQSPELYEAAHIFFPADPDDSAAREEAEERAKVTIAEIQDDPARFAELARARSACPSSKDGGSLGQVTRGQTVPEFETFLDSLEEGQLCPVPVPTRFGLHVVRLDRREPGQELPFEAVKERIAEYLRERVYRRAAAQYVRILAGQADIRGFEMDGAQSPLVQ
ncbi:peptidylprolyl isomerase [Ferruginivarius sediminum]|uniref:Parvulin-like PPIase n=1 Tax=Ferruginivarius sediminum TaxID=2661937 RepID=A0A369TDX4_9PROT|nr:peptidylprolyl isomerase [Ferruginivarius sediminum]RDD63042.1 peptidylprolyl isomerase [Ferruginivarius sediminum]